MKETILKLLSESKRALSFEDIASLMYLDTDKELELLKKVLDDLLSNFDIYKTSGDKFQDMEYSPIKKGIYRVSKDGKGRIVTKKKTYLVNDNGDNEAIDGDTVLFETIAKGKGNQAQVLFVSSRNLNQIIGEVENINDEAFLRTNNFKLEKLNIKLTDPSLVTGTKVIVKLKPTGIHNDYIGEVVKNIGYKDAPFVDIKEVCYKHGFIEDFGEEAQNQTDKIRTVIRPNDLKGRLDLRNVELLSTMDGKDTKDMDDAITLVKLPNGNDLVGVHIADVTHYMPEDSPLDKEAFLRGTSGYFANTVVPMLPQKLSNGVCSLNENVDRLTMSFFMEVDKKGEIVDSFITPSIIRSRAKTNYDDVNTTLNVKDESDREKLTDIYKNFEENFKYMNEVSKTQIKRRDRRGALDMDSRELKIYCDENGLPELFVPRKNQDAENIVESFMLLAGEAAGLKLKAAGAPAVYRVHVRPTVESIESFIDFYRALGYQYNGEISNSSKSVQAILKEIQTKSEKDVLQRIFLRHLMKAEYSHDNVGHSGLAMVIYVQVTSPIRRYGDDVNHRLIKEYVCSGQKFEEEKKLWNKKLSKVYDVNFIPGPVRPEPTYQRDNEWRSVLPYTAEHLSKREKDELACDAEVNRIKSAQYMEDRIGELNSGTIVGVSKDFLDIELDNLIEGKLPLESLPGDYECNSSHYAVEDYKIHDAFRIGDRLEVQTTYANKDTQSILFAYGKTLSKVNGYMVEEPVKMNKGKRKELKRKYGK